MRSDGNAQCARAGQPVDAMLYNGVAPGPEIRVTEGDVLRVICHNQMTQSTAIHFHGLRLPNAMDGVPFITQLRKCARKALTVIS